MRRSAPRLRLKKGFSLIELVMTIVVVAIAAIPLSLLVSRHIPSTFAMEDYARALNLARLDIEQVNNTVYAGIVPTSYPSGNYDISRAVSEVTSGTEARKQITVTVTRHGTATVLISLISRIAKNVTYSLL